MDWLAVVAPAIAVLVQLGALAVWGGRIGAQLEQLERRLERLEEPFFRRFNPLEVA